MARRPDIALVSLGTTMGLREHDADLARAITAAGASCQMLAVRIGPAAALRRTMALTDLVEGLAARRAARAAQAGAVIYSSITAALLQPSRSPSAIRFDAIAATNRPGLGGAWQRRRERSVLRAADLLLPLSDAARDAAGLPAVVLPPPVVRAPEADPGAPDALAYAANSGEPELGLLCSAWAEVAPAGSRLGIGGIDEARGRRLLRRAGVAEPPGLEWIPPLPRARWLALLAGARVFLNVTRIEDWGAAQMEALAAGTPLVTVPAPGANEALALARGIEPSLVATDRSRGALERALAAGFALTGDARARYAARARELLAPYSEEAFRAAVAERVLPPLLGRSRS